MRLKCFIGLVLGVFVVGRLKNEENFDFFFEKVMITVQLNLFNQFSELSIIFSAEFDNDVTSRCATFDNGFDNVVRYRHFTTMLQVVVQRRLAMSFDSDDRDVSP